MTTGLSSPPSVNVIEGIENDVELPDEGHPKLGALNVAVVRHNFSRRVELQDGLLRHQSLIWS